MDLEVGAGLNCHLSRARIIACHMRKTLILGVGHHIGWYPKLFLLTIHAISGAHGPAAV